MKALISPREISPYVAGWTYNSKSKQWEPVFDDVPDSWRVAQVQEDAFEIAEPLFWVDCADNIVADLWFYQTSTGEILPIPDPASIPAETPAESGQPTVVGAQTL